MKDLADKLIFLLAGFVLMGGVSLVTDYLQAKIAPEKPLPSYRYLAAPGNRQPCKTYLAGQADSIKAPQKTRCTFSSRTVWL